MSSTHARSALALALTALLVGAAFGQQNAPPQVQAVERDLVAAYEAEEWDRALGFLDRLLELQPAAPRHPYNLACVHARAGNKDKALQWLQVSAEMGFSDALAETDADLESLTSAPEHETAIKCIRYNRERAAGALKKEMADYKPLVVEPESRPEVIVVALHGYGQTAKAIADVWRPVTQSRKALLVAPQATHKARNGYEWGVLGDAEAIVEHALAAVREKEPLKDLPVVLTGFSQGGYMAYNLAARHPDRFSGVIPVAGRFNKLLVERLMAAHGDLKADEKPRFAILVGSNDWVLDDNRTAVETLKSTGIPASIEVFEGVDHAFPKEAEKELTEALEAVLSG